MTTDGTEAAHAAIRPTRKLPFASAEPAVTLDRSAGWKGQEARDTIVPNLGPASGSGTRLGPV